MQSILLTISIIIFSNFANADTRIEVDQSDAFVNVALESASTVCESKIIESFLENAQGNFSLVISSKSFPTGLQSVSFVFESKTQQLAVIKPYRAVGSSLSVSPRCNLSNLSLSNIN